jgi:hypothetical protein
MNETPTTPYFVFTPHSILFKQLHAEQTIAKSEEQVFFRYIQEKPFHIEAI